MKLSTDRILTTHVGSLPRPQPLVALLIKKDRNEPYDAAEFAALVRQAVADIVARQVKIGIDVVSDGEIEQGRLCDLCARTSHRLRRRTVCAEAQSRRRTLCRFPQAAGAVHRAAADPPAVLHRTDRAPGPCIGAARHRQLQGGDRGVEAGGRVHAGGVTRRGVHVPAQPALSDPRRLYRGDRIGDARGVRIDRQCRHRGAARQSRTWRWRGTPGSRT